MIKQVIKYNNSILTTIAMNPRDNNNTKIIKDNSKIRASIFSKESRIMIIILLIISKTHIKNRPLKSKEKKQ